MVPSPRVKAAPLAGCHGRSSGGVGGRPRSWFFRRYESPSRGDDVGVVDEAVDHGGGGVVEEGIPQSNGGTAVQERASAARRRACPQKRRPAGNRWVGIGGPSARAVAARSTASSVEVRRPRC